MKNLDLERPLVFFDLETTGLDIVNDRIVQIGLVRVEPDGNRHTFMSLVDPQRPIPAEATAVHGITDADVAGKPTFGELLPQLAPLLEGTDLAGFNSIRFDLPLLAEEFRRAGGEFGLNGRRHLDACVIFHQMERRDLTAAMKFYCDQEFTDAHDALADAGATLEILDAQLGRYPDLPRDLDELHAFCNQNEGRWVDSTRKFVWVELAAGAAPGESAASNVQGELAIAAGQGGATVEGGKVFEAVLTFGKHKGRTLREVARSTPDYLQWILNSDFSSEVKQIVQDALQGRFPTRS